MRFTVAPLKAARHQPPARQAAPARVPTARGGDEHPAGVAQRGREHVPRFDGPVAAELGTLERVRQPGATGMGRTHQRESGLDAIEVWEMHNFTQDAHPIHIHEVQFQVVDRQPFGGAARPPEPCESGFKDTVIAYPGEITRVKALFDLPGLYVWHCHIVEHEDNEMMRPYHVGPPPLNMP